MTTAGQSKTLSSPGNAPVRIVVVGAGFGGLTFCKKFRHPDAQVTLIDRTNHHLFQPLLYQVATAGLSAPEVAQPIRSILSRTPRLQVFMDEVVSVDLQTRMVQCSRAAIPFDYLILAVGGVTSYFGRPEWEQFAPGLKTLEDAMTIRNRLLLAFEKAETEADPARRQAFMTILVVGGGPTGVEVAGACAELAYHVLRRDFDHIDPANARILLIEGGTRLLSHLPEELSLKAQRQLERKGVQVLTNCRVKDIQEGTVTLANGEQFHAQTIVWAAGVMGHPVARTLGVEVDRAGRLKVRPDLSLPGHPHVFAIGDLAAVESEGNAVPGVAPAAMQMAKYVARVLESELHSTPATPAPERPAFRYLDKGTMATIGRNAGVAWFGPVKLSGWLAWVSWLFVHLIFLIGFRNKVSVLFSWVHSYLTYKLGARIVVPGTRAQNNAPSPAEGAL